MDKKGFFTSFHLSSFSLSSSLFCFIVSLVFLLVSSCLLSSLHSIFSSLLFNLLSSLFSCLLVSPLSSYLAFLSCLVFFCLLFSCLPSAALRGPLSGRNSNCSGVFLVIRPNSTLHFAPFFVHPLFPVCDPHIQKWVIFVHRRPCVCDT